MNAEITEAVANAISNAAWDAMRAQGFSGGWDHDEFGRALAEAAITAIEALSANTVAPDEQATDAMLPSPELFYHQTIPEPLSTEERQWLVEQLHRYPKRINEARTCAIGALTDMAVTEFCRLMGEISATQPTDYCGIVVMDDDAEWLLGFARNFNPTDEETRRLNSIAERIASKPADGLIERVKRAGDKLLGYATNGRPGLIADAVQEWKEAIAALLPQARGDAE